MGIIILITSWKHNKQTSCINEEDDEAVRWRTKWNTKIQNNNTHTNNTPEGRKAIVTPCLKTNVLCWRAASQASSNILQWPALQMNLTLLNDDDLPCHLGESLLGLWVGFCKVVWLVAQPTRFMLRLCLRQHGTHFFSDLEPGDAGAGAADPCFLWMEKERERETRRQREKCDWVFVLAVTRQCLIINSSLPWPPPAKQLVWSQSSQRQPRPAGAG